MLPSWKRKFSKEMQEKKSWKIITFLNEKQTVVGGVRAARLNKFLNDKGIESKLITRSAINSNEISVSEPIIAKLPGLSKIVSPDVSIFWINRIYRFLEKESFNVLFTTSPLHGVHKLGIKLKSGRKNNLLWIADFRDPFTLNPFYKSKFIKKSFDRRFEGEVLEKADVVVFNTKLHKEEYLLEYPAINPDKCLVIRNGYDGPPNFNDRKRKNKIIYSGGNYKGKALEPCAIFLRELKDQGISIDCDFIGEESKEFSHYEDVINYKGRVESGSVPKVLVEYKYGLVYLPKEFLNSSRVAAKLYDYLGAGLIPICINPSKEMMTILSEVNYGMIIKEDKMKSISYEKLFKKVDTQKLNVESISKFNRNYQFNILFDHLVDNGLM